MEKEVVRWDLKDNHGFGGISKDYDWGSHDDKD